MDDERSQDGDFDDDIDEQMQDDEADNDDAEVENDEMDQDEGDDDDVNNDDDEGGDGDGDGENENESKQPEGEMASADATQSSDARKAVDAFQPMPEILSAATYDIVPTVAAPQSTSINAICGTADSRWIFTGGADGYIRQYNWAESVNGKTQLTVAQRHPFVDSVVKAGVLMSYWENWDAKKMTSESTTLTTTQTLSPVYSLACQRQGLWLLSGTASGAIRLQTVRHDEGKEVALLQKHTSAVSVLSLSSDQTGLLSGAWDKAVVDWDLNTGQIRTEFALSGGQVSCIEPRPVSSVPVPYESGEVIKTSNTLSTNNAAPLTANNPEDPQTPVAQDKPAATPDSLFGNDENDDDLFGDSNNNALSNGNAFGFDESEMNHTNEDVPTATSDHITAAEDQPTTTPPIQPTSSPPKDESSASALQAPVINGVTNTTTQPLANGVPHATDEDEATQPSTSQPAPPSDTTPTSDSTFLATSQDGTIRIWDRRTPQPIARITPVDTPPWCLSACWAPSGNAIYAGRRNNTVEEYDLRSGRLNRPSRTFRFPLGSGPVTSVRAMPNGRHLICASYDILRLYDLQAGEGVASHGGHGAGTVPFLIVPGHRTGTVSSLYLSRDARFLLSAGGNRGWQGVGTEVLLGYEIGVPATA